MVTGELHGVITPIITPVDDDDRVDEPAFRRQIQRLIAAGIHGIFVGGSAGEGPLLTDREWERMVTIARDETGEQAYLLGGAMDTSTQRVLAKLRTLRELGYGHCVVTPTYYLTLRHPDEFLRLFGECANYAGEMDVVAYNIPPCTSSVIPVEVVIELTRRRWIRRIKESSGDLNYLTRLIREGGEVGLSVLQGDERHMPAALKAGAVGIVPGCSNYDPEAFLGAYRAVCIGDDEELARCAARIAAVREAVALAGDQWLSGIKYGVSRLGIGSGRTVSPLQPLTATQRAAIDAFMGVA
jgi:4-hydroxy-tetrahydrodipicolinate synthase